MMRQTLIKKINDGEYFDIEEVVKENIIRMVGINYVEIIKDDLKNELLLSIYLMDEKVIANNLDADTIDKLARQTIKWLLSPGKNGTKNGMSKFYKEHILPLKGNIEFIDSYMEIPEEIEVKREIPLKALIRQLPWWDQMLIKLYLGIDCEKMHTYKEISKATGVKDYMVSRMMKNILSNLEIKINDLPN